MNTRRNSSASLLFLFLFFSFLSPMNSRIFSCETCISCCSLFFPFLVNSQIYSSNTFSRSFPGVVVLYSCETCVRTHILLHGDDCYGHCPHISFFRSLVLSLVSFVALAHSFSFSLSHLSSLITSCCL